MGLYHYWYKTKEFPRVVKHWYQRAKKGYSYRDLWAIDSWFMADFKKSAWLP
jgi:hypothetical protein